MTCVSINRVRGEDAPVMNRELSRRLVGAAVASGNPAIQEAVEALRDADQLQVLLESEVPGDASDRVVSHLSTLKREGFFPVTIELFSDEERQEFFEDPAVQAHASYTWGDFLGLTKKEGGKVAAEGASAVDLEGAVGGETEFAGSGGITAEEAGRIAAEHMAKKNPAWPKTTVGKVEKQGDDYRAMIWIGNSFQPILWTTPFYVTVDGKTGEVLKVK